MDEDDGGAEHGGAGSSASGCSLGRRRRWCELLGIGVVRDEGAGEDNVGEGDGDGKETAVVSGTTGRRRRGGMGTGRSRT